MGSAVATLTTSAKLGCSTLVPSEAHARWWVGLQGCPCLLRPSRPAGFAGSTPPGPSPTTAKGGSNPAPNLLGSIQGHADPWPMSVGTKGLASWQRGIPPPALLPRLSLA